MPYIIKYKDGFYNVGYGHPCDKWEADRYPTMEQAEQVASDLAEVEEIEEVEK